MITPMKIVIEIDIEAGEVEEDGYRHLDAGKIHVKSDGLTRDELEGLAEMWGQSDWFFIDFNADVLDGMTRE